MKLMAYVENYVLMSFFAMSCNMEEGGRRGGLLFLWNDEYGGQNTKLNFSLGIYSEIFEMKVLQGGCIEDILMRYSITMKKMGLCPEITQKLRISAKQFNDCYLTDLGYKEFKFTWSNNQEGDKLIEERLDMFLASEKWVENFGNFQVDHLVRVISDHAPTWIHEIKTPDRQNRRKCLFRVEEMWFSDQSFLNTCKDPWTQHPYQFSLMA
ncbi:hypothetical protein C2S52_018367 [Perilla frutescens var. hirtella]|nr:hypothetical protein C2S52_018367 [Perilla frutescens var. hirtella]KAH6812081.1 hypothetical protein C2S51_025843 [Perilla frutescens var. frutescens]